MVDGFVLYVLNIGEVFCILIEVIILGYIILDGEERNEDSAYFPSMD